MLALLDRLLERLEAGINWAVNSFFNFLDKLMPPKVESPFATPEEIQDFFESSRDRRKKRQKTLDFFPENGERPMEVRVDARDHGEIPPQLLREVPVEELGNTMLGTEISKDSLLKDSKNWAHALSDQINTVEGTHFIIDPYNSHYFYPFKEEMPVYYVYKQKATEYYTVFDLLKDRIAPLIRNIPIAIIRPQTGTMLVVQFEDNQLYLLREQDRIRIFKHNSNTTRVLGTLLKKYREQCSEFV